MIESELLQETKKRRNKNYGKVLAMSLSVGVIAMLVTVIDYFFPTSVILTFPFLLIPFVICALIATTRLIHEPDFDFKSFYTFYVVGLTPTVRTAFRLLATFFKALLIMLVCYFVAFNILTLMPDIKSLYAQLMADVAANDYSKYVSLFESFIKNDEVFQAYLIIRAVSYGLAFICFVISMLHKMLYANCKTNFFLPSGKDQPIFGAVFKKHSRTYFKGLLKINWHMYVALVVGYVIGCLLAYFFVEPLAMSFLGILFSILFIIPSLPNLLIYNDVVMESLTEELREQNAGHLTSIVQDMSKNDNMTEEQKEALNQFLNQVNKKTDVVDGEYKEVPSEDKKDQEKNEE